MDDHGDTVIRRLLYVFFVAVGGWVFIIPKWILMGTRGSRDRRKMVKLQRKLLHEQRRRPPAV